VVEADAGDAGTLQREPGVAVEGEPGVVLVLLAHDGAGDGVDDDDLALVVLDVAGQVEGALLRCRTWPATGR
jgi:hypothetical protein